MTKKISPETEEKRLEQVEDMFRNWDLIPDLIRGRIEGTAKTLQDLNLFGTKKAG